MDHSDLDHDQSLFRKMICLKHFLECGINQQRVNHQQIIRYHQIWATEGKSWRESLKLEVDEFERGQNQTQTQADREREMGINTYTIYIWPRIIYFLMYGSDCVASKNNPQS